MNKKSVRLRLKLALTVYKDAQFINIPYKHKQPVLDTINKIRLGLPDERFAPTVGVPLYDIRICGYAMKTFTASNHRLYRKDRV